MSMSITERAAHLSQYANLAYTSNAPGLDGSAPIMVSPPSDNGFYAAAYRDAATGKIVVAFRGTEPLDVHDVFGADAALAPVRAIQSGEPLPVVANDDAGRLAA